MRSEVLSSPSPVPRLRNSLVPGLRTEFVLVVWRLIQRRMRHTRHFIHALLGCVAACSLEFIPLPGNAAESSPSFERDIRPILKAHCFHCHGEGESLKGGIDLRLRRLFADKKTDDGIVLSPGHPDQSLMLKLVQAGDMPKGEKKLNPQQIALIQEWIAKGAPTLRDEPPEIPRGFQITEEERHFWAYQPIRRPNVPDWKETDRVRTAIDVFALKELRKQGLAFAPEADRLTLIRRVSIDLTGLPPSPEAVDRFLNDDAPGAYERLVDRVLDSPQYGERWARHWLDVAGYADSNGYAEADSPRPHAWRYRDYVIRAHNTDKPWNEFLLEQLAGDELAGASQDNAAAKAKDAVHQERLIATGFLRLGPDGTGDEVADANLARNQVMAETLKIVSSSMLGLTVGCAQCHDHRYDPISQKDYYSLRAIFEPAYNWKQWRPPAQRLVSLYTAEDRKKADEIEAEARKIDEAAAQLRKDLLEKVFEKELAKLPEDVRASAKTARNTPGDKRTPEQIALLKKHPSADVQGALDLYDPEANKKVLAKQDEANKVRATKPPEPFIMALTEPAAKPPATFLFSRGDHDQPKEVLPPAELEIIRRASVSKSTTLQAEATPAGLQTTPSKTQLPGQSASLAAIAPERNSGAGGTSAPDIEQFLSQITATNTPLATSGRRLAYARWLTSGRHPLVARVLVNRFWAHHFGRGLVSSLGDFGQLGERPTHPELLDWLADEFMASGWKLKSFHRLLMTSTVYRQSGDNEAAQKADPDNRWYGRMKPRRLDAETLRDSILFVSGSLNPEAFGPPVPIARDGSGRVVTGQQKVDGRGDPTLVDPIGDRAYRRSIYVETRRSIPLTVLDVFDAPVMSPNCESRGNSTVAPQALMMLNDTFVLAQSQRFAERLFREHPGDVRKQLTRAWKLTYGIPPSEREMTDSLVYLAEESESIRAHLASLATPNGSAPKQGDKATTPTVDIPTRAMASLCQALMGANRFLYVD